MSILILAASATRSGSRRAAANASRMIATRQGVGSAELGARKDKPHELALLGGLRVVEDGRHLGDFRDRRLLRAQEKDELAVADELLVDAKLSVGGASPLHLAALHGKDRVGRALVALDDAELGAEHVIEYGRQDAQ